MKHSMQQPDILSKTKLKAYKAAVSRSEPSGPSLRYQEVYAQIQAARKQDDNLPQGVWQHDRKTADWAEVMTLCEQALKHQSKDLQLAAWLTEAWLHQYGLYGLSQGLGLIHALLAEFWDSLHPYSQTDPEYRLAPLSWFDQAALKPLSQIELTAPTQEATTLHDLTVYTFWQYQNHVLKSPNSSPSSGQQGGKNPQAQAFYAAINATPLAFYVQQEQALTDALATVREIERFITKQYPDFPSILLRLRQRLEQMHHFFARILKERQAAHDQAAAQQDNASQAKVVDPASSQAEATTGQNLDPVTSPKEPSLTNEAAIESRSAPENKDNPAALMDDSAAHTAASQSDFRIRNRADAYQHLGEIADYLETLEPHSLTPLLLRRAIAWGDMSLTELITDLAAQGCDIHTITQFLSGTRTPNSK
jgi:type VI secretion system protein ImpA